MTPNDPIYFSTETYDQLHPWVRERLVGAPVYSLYGWAPSLPYGVHAGWLVSGQQRPRAAFTEHLPAGDWSGGCPIGLTPIQS